MACERKNHNATFHFRRDKIVAKQKPYTKRLNNNNKNKKKPRWGQMVNILAKNIVEYMQQILVNTLLFYGSN